MSKHPKRRSYFVDKKVQGALLIRAARYWLLSLTVVAMLTVLGCLFITPGIAALVEFREQVSSLLGAVLMALLASTLVLPVILVDLARLSNRFAGPMLRLRRSMQQAADGEQVAPIRFRDGDYWQEFADEFNRLLDRLERAERCEDLPTTKYVAPPETVETA